MKDGNSKKSKLSWTKTLVKKWFNLHGKTGDFQADNADVDEWRNSFTGRRESCTVEKCKTEKWFGRDHDMQIRDVHNYRIFASTWNVAGKSPPSYLNLEEWLHSTPPADIYVLGFQEIVPLSAGNVLGTEDNAPARKWLAMIRKTLNTLPESVPGCPTPTPPVADDRVIDLDVDFDGSSRRKDSTFFHRCSYHSVSRSMRMMESRISITRPTFDHRFSVCDRVIYGHRTSDYYDRWNGYSDDEDESEARDSPVSYTRCVSNVDRDRQSRYYLVASKQMVGIFLMVWIKSELKDTVRDLKVSCVGRGLMGYLGNKGSISISLSLHQTSFCFICSHLTSGEKDGDELRRNSDVMEILRKTRFPQMHATGAKSSPQTILDHDRVIWLGDLNYRIALAYRRAKALVEMRNWRALLENDQLRLQQRRGRVFAGWSEGEIYFPPTYKYSNNSDRYAGENIHPKEKRRTPAWCDRILWHGRGIRQLSYVRGESRFSDHRPVYSIFVAEVESIKRNRIKKSTTYSSSQVEAEELLPCGYR